jgi:hypothetical protein
MVVGGCHALRGADVREEVSMEEEEEEVVVGV